MATEAATRAGSATTTTQASTLVGEWLALLDRQGVSARNRDAHRMGVERLAEYLGARSVDDATATDLRGFIAYLGELGVSEQSRGVYRQILEKWLQFANEERRRVQVAEAAAAALTGAEPFVMPEPAAASAPAPVSVPVSEPIAIPAAVVEAEPDEDCTVVFDVGGDPVGAPSTEDHVSEEQAESTWPFATPKPPGHPSMQGLAAAFDGATPAHPPVAPVTIDFAPDSSDDTYVIEMETEAPAAPAFTMPGPLPTTSSFAVAESSPFTAEPAPPSPFGATSFDADAATSFAAPAASSFTAEEAPPAAVVEFPAPGVPAALPPPMPDFGFQAPQAPAQGTGFSFESPSGFGSGSVTQVSGPESADATPVRPLQPAQPMAMPSASRREAPVRNEAGEHVMGEGVTSIPFAGAAIGVGAPAKKAAEPAKGGASAGIAELKGKVQAWGLRQNGTERNDLDLSQIRNMAATGALTPSSIIRKPGGEWMKAGEYQPLRSVFQHAKLMASGQVQPEAPPVRGPLAHPVAMAWLGAIIGAAAGAGAWWFAAVVAGAEVLPMALVVGVLSGALASWLGRGESYTALGASAVATIGAMCVGRTAVYQTLKSGVIGSGGTESSDPLAFLALSATGASLTWWGIAVALAIAVGGVGLFLRRR